MKLTRRSLISCLLLMSFGHITAVQAADTGRFAGYLVDRSCADNLKQQNNPLSSVQTHSRECALNASCSQNGYALFCKGKWYELDSKGNDLARKVLQASAEKEGHLVLVSGVLDKSLIKATALKEMGAN